MSLRFDVLNKSDNASWWLVRSRAAARTSMIEFGFVPGAYLSPVAGGRRRMWINFDEPLLDNDASAIVVEVAIYKDTVLG